jgi:tetratricopeptide (TPR) repeat protein
MFFSYLLTVNVRSDVKSKGELLLSLIACLNNLSACYLSMKDYTKAKDTCVQALQLEPDNVKALIRASKASLALHEYEECALCLNTVSEEHYKCVSLLIECYSRHYVL